MMFACAWEIVIFISCCSKTPNYYCNCVKRLVLLGWHYVFDYKKFIKIIK